MSSIEGAAILRNPADGQTESLSRPKNLARPVRSRLSWLGFSLTTLVIVLGWTGRNERNITAENGLGYTLGIVGALMMLALLIYPMRKRIKSLRALGSTRSWFMAHMLLGIIGPVLILYHSNFSVSSLNSQVALYCTLVVAFSGLIGRYLYAQIHRGLYGKKRTLRSLVADMQRSLTEITISGPVIENFQKQLACINDLVIEPPRNVFHSALRPLLFAVRTRWVYLRMSLRLRQDMARASNCNHALRGAEKNDAAAIRRDLRRHLRQVRRVAHLSFFERLFSLWHILHLPFFFMLVISAIVHVIAVHLY